MWMHLGKQGNQNQQSSVSHGSIIMARLAVWVCCFTILHFACSFTVVRMRSAPEMLGPRVARLYNRRGCVPSMSSSEANQVKKLQEQLKGTCIYLIGMTGCGKSTVGAELASQLGYRFLDTDALAEYMIEMPIAQFFQQEGEEKFRDVEHQVLSQLAQYTRVVVATGGGIVTRPNNWGLMQQGLIVYLDIPPEDIQKRLVAIPEEVTKRPLLAGTDALGKLTELAEARRDKYLAADVHYVVDPLHAPAQTAEEVQRALLRCIADNPPRWRTWKERQEQRARDMAAVANPKVAHELQQKRMAEEGGGAGQVQPAKGSVQYVALSDVLSGKVVLPPQADGS